MFCPSCGTEYAIGLPYCNRCGANLNAAPSPQAPPVQVTVTKPALIIGIVLVLLTLGGFGMLISGAVELSRAAQMGSDGIFALIALGMLTILTTDIFLVRQLSRLITASLSSGTQPKARPQPAFTPAPQAQLRPPAPPHLSGAPSVTEHTTRFFEPVDREPAPAEDPPRAEKLDR